jgi:uncharacterized protein (DUF2236 family)
MAADSTTTMPIRATAWDPEAAVEEFRRNVQRRIRHFLVGDVTPVRDLSQPIVGDTGLFGPDSATWKVHADSAILVGAVRALLLQTMHPLAMAGVAEHSRYRSDPTGRLWQTSRYVGTVTFGSTKEADAAIRRVKQVHERVRGVAPDGRPYEANDPHLLLWVHHTLVESFLFSYQRFAAEPLAGTDADRYVAEQAEIAERFGAEPAARSVAQLRAWMKEERADLRATASAREAVRFLLFPPLSLALRPAYGILAAAAVGSLPAWMRWDLRLPILPLTDRFAVRPAATVLTRAIDWALKAPAEQGLEATE